MRIMRLANSSLSPAIAERYVGESGSKAHYNLKHGTRGSDGWRWSAGLHDASFECEEEFKTLDGCNYDIVPVKVDGRIRKDSVGNIYYNIFVDNDPSHAEDIILLWTIPGRTYTDIEFSVSGDVDVLGEGKAAKSRTKSAGYTVAPVLLIYGDCEFSWAGKCAKGNAVGQTIKYRYGDKDWKISPIEEMRDV